MKLVTIETFLTVAALRHFRKAAERLNTTQPNVSARISELERIVGGSLFFRQKGKVALTPLGRHMLPFAEKVLETTHEFSSQAEINIVQEGTLRLSLSETMVSTVLPPFIERFSETFPNVAVNLVVDSTTNQRRDLLDRAVDLSFLMGPVSEYDIINLPLISLPLIWTAAPNHPAAELEIPDGSALAQWPIITYASNSRPYTELRSAFRQGKIAAPRFFSSNSLNASLAMTINGMGISTLPEAFATPHLEAGDIIKLNSTFGLGPLQFTASFANDPLNPVIKSAAEIAMAVTSEMGSSKTDKKN